MPVNLGFMSYHHGNLRAAVLEVVDQVVREEGTGSVSLRGLGNRLGVSHSAVVHQFGSLAGVLTAFAVQGFELLGQQVADAGDSFLDVGIAFVNFSAQHPAHFAVMYSPSRLDRTDPALVGAQRRALSGLVGSASSRAGAEGEQARAEALAGWALMHGLASLHSTGALHSSALVEIKDTEDLLAVARTIGGFLFGRRPDPTATPDPT